MPGADVIAEIESDARAAADLLAKVKANVASAHDALATNPDESLAIRLAGAKTMLAEVRAQAGMVCAEFDAAIGA